MSSVIVTAGVPTHAAKRWVLPFTATRHLALNIYPPPEGVIARSARLPLGGAAAGASGWGPTCWRPLVVEGATRGARRVAVPSPYSLPPTGGRPNHSHLHTPPLPVKPRPRP